MSLASCMDKVNVSAELRAELKASVTENISKGMPRSEAERAAVNSKIAETIGSLESIRDRLEEKGHDVAKVEIPTERVKPRASVAEESAPKEKDILRYDNPGGEWLKKKQQYAEEDYAKSKISGPITASSETISLPVDKIKDIPGSLGEVRKAGERQYYDLRKKVESEGFKNNSPILIGVNHRGDPYIIEGNTRVAVAKDLGIKNIPAEVRYYSGGELENGSFSPKILNSIAQPKITTEMTPIGEQSVIPGAERISDKQLAEKKMGEKKYADVAQKPMDDGLFDLGARKQQEINFAVQPAGETQPYAMVREKPAARSAAQRSDMVAAMRNAAARIMGPNANLQFFDKISVENRNGTTDKDVAGVHLPEQKVIAIALGAPNPEGVLRHEAIHFLRDAGLLSGQEWTTLSKQAKSWRKMFDIDGRYKDMGLSEEDLNEEAVADAYMAWYNGNLDIKNGTIQSIMQKLSDFYAAVRNYLFQNNGVQSWRDVFDGIESGAVAGEVRGAPGYNIEINNDAVQLVAPDGTKTDHASVRDAEYAATDAAVFNELRLKSGDKADYSLGAEEEKKTTEFADKHMHPYSGSLTQTIKDTADAVARMFSDDGWKNALRRATADSYADLLTQERKFAPDRLDRQQIAYQRANLANKAGAVFDVFQNGRRVEWDAKDRVYKANMDKKSWTDMLAPILVNEQTKNTFTSYWLALDAVTPRKRKLDMKKATELFGAEKAKKLFADNAVVNDKITVPLSGIEYGTEKNITEAEAREIIRIVDAQTKNGKNVYKDTVNNMQEYHRKIVDGLVGSGAVSEAGRENWDHDYYAPARKIMQDTFDIARGTRGKIIKKRTGGPTIFSVTDKNGNVTQFKTEAEANALAEKNGGTVKKEIQKRQDLFLSMAQLHSAMIQKAYQTVASQNAAQLLEAAGLAHVVGKQVDFKSEFLRDALDENGSNLDVESAQWMAPLIDKGNNTIGIPYNGKITTYRIDDPNIMKMMEHLAGYAAYSPNAAMRTLMMAKGLFTRMITLTPVFQMRNVVRDAGAREFVSPDQHKLFSDTVNGIKGALNDEKVIQLMMAGGDVGYYTRTAEDAMDALNDKLSPEERGLMYWSNPVRLVHGMERLGRISELTGRLAMFNAAKRAGATDLEAGFEAADLGDYTRKGLSDSMRVLTSITPFLNPRIQGLDKLARTASRKQTQKNMIVKSAILMTAALMLAAHNNEDEETRRDYEQLPDYVKNANFVFNIRNMREAALGRKLKPDETAFIVIPKPFEYGLPATIVERTYTAAQNDMLDGKGAGDWGDAAQAGQDFVIGTLAFNPLSNPLLGLPVEQMTNYKFFQGQPIEPKSKDNLRAVDKYTDATSATSIAISKMIDDTFGGTISPARLEHLINGTTASMGDMVLSAMDAMAGDRPTQRFNTVPVVGTFTSPAVGSGNNIRNRFYKLDRQINETAGSITALRNERNIEAATELMSRPKTKALMAVKPQMAALKSQMNTYQKEINHLQRGSNGMTPDARRERIDMLTQKINDVAYKFKDVELKYEELRDKE